MGGIGISKSLISIGAGIVLAAAPFWHMDTTWAQTVTGDPANTNATDGGFFADWAARAEAAKESQPQWITPVATVTPRLEQEFRYDQLWQHSGNGTNLQNFDGGKGLELIPTTSNEIIFNLPPYEERTGKNPAKGFGDWPVLLIKQRFISANEANGNYIVTGFFGVQAPTGAASFTSHAWVVTPTLAAGKGWGKFDVQATIAVPIPLSHERSIGTSMVSNIAFQYHLGRFFWPELEANYTYWADGPRGGKNQLFLTPGLILGRFPLSGHSKAIVGMGYQIAVSPKLTRLPILTPVYQDELILTARTTF
jgi:hypothetical protein